MKRRQFLRAGAAAAAATAVAGCSNFRAAVRRAGAPAPARAAAPPPPPPGPPPQVIAMYGPAPTERFPLPAVDPRRIPERFWRRRVDFRTTHRPGTVLVDRNTYYLYLVEPGGTAMRYGVSLGRAGFGWAGRGRIAWKRPWPTWTPPDEMIAREPELERWSVRNGGMPPGLNNPLGARALYIFQNGRDTLYRIHGTPKYDSIGQNASAGCVRLVNQDVIDLYERVRPGARLIVA